MNWRKEGALGQNIKQKKNKKKSIYLNSQISFKGSQERSAIRKERGEIEEAKKRT